MAVGVCGKDLKTFEWRIQAYELYVCILFVMGLYRCNHNIFSLYLYYDCNMPSLLRSSHMSKYTYDLHMYTYIYVSTFPDVTVHWMNGILFCLI